MRKKVFIHSCIFLIFINMIMFFCFDLFHPYDELEVLLEMFDFRAAEINNERIEAAIL